MLSDLGFRVAELERRLHNILRLGTVCEADYGAARIRVRSGELVSGWVPWIAARAMGDRNWWAPRTGEQVMLLSPSGDPAQAVALPSLYQTAAPPPADSPDIHRTVYPDGAVTEYDSAAHALKAVIPGTADVKADERVTLTAPLVELDGGLIRLIGPVVSGGRNGEAHAVRFHGSVEQTGGDYTNPEGDVTASGISLQNHTHPENGGRTGPPSA